MTRQPQFGRRLRKLREERGISQRSLADGLVTASYISHLEAGRRVPTLDVVVRLARSLDVPVAELVGREADDLPPDLAEPVPLAGARALEAIGAQDCRRTAGALGAAYDEARRDEDVARQLEVGLRLAHVLGALHRVPQRVALLTALLELPGVDVSPDLQVVLGAGLASGLRETGDLLAAREVALGAAERLPRSGLRGSGEHAALLGVLVSVLVELSELDRARPVVAELLEVAGGVDSSPVTGRAEWVAARAYAQLGEADRALRHLRAAHELLAAPTLPLRDWVRLCRASATILLDVDGDLDEARDWLQNAAAGARMLDLPVERRRVAALRARYELATSQPERCVATADLLLDDPDALPAVELRRVRLWRARALAEIGRPAEAIGLLRALAVECEEAEAFPMAVRIWRDIDELRSAGPGA